MWIENYLDYFEFTPLLDHSIIICQIVFQVLVMYLDEKQDPFLVNTALHPYVTPVTSVTMISELPETVIETGRAGSTEQASLA